MVKSTQNGRTEFIPVHRLAAARRWVVRPAHRPPRKETRPRACGLAGYLVATAYNLVRMAKLLAPVQEASAVQAA